MQDNKKSTYTGFTDARKEANKRYMEKFVEVKVRISPSKREDIKNHAEKQGESLNVFIVRAIDEAMKTDNHIIKPVDSGK